MIFSHLSLELFFLHLSVSPADHVHSCRLFSACVCFVWLFYRPVFSGRYLLFSVHFATVGCSRFASASVFCFRLTFASFVYNWPLTLFFQVVRGWRINYWWKDDETAWSENRRHCERGFGRVWRRREPRVSASVGESTVNSASLVVTWWLFCLHFFSPSCVLCIVTKFLVLCCILIILRLFFMVSLSSFSPFTHLFFSLTHTLPANNGMKDCIAHCGSRLCRTYRHIVLTHTSFFDHLVLRFVCFVLRPFFWCCFVSLSLLVMSCFSMWF